MTPEFTYITSNAPENNVNGFQVPFTVMGVYIDLQAQILMAEQNLTSHLGRFVKFINQTTVGIVPTLAEAEGVVVGTHKTRPQVLVALRQDWFTVMPAKKYADLPSIHLMN